MFVYGTRFCVEKKEKNLEHLNTKFLPIFIGRNKKFTWKDAAENGVHDFFWLNRAGSYSPGIRTWAISWGKNLPQMSFLLF